MKRIIVNSLTLAKLLFDFMEWNNSEDIVITCDNKTLQFGHYENTLNVESQADWKIETTFRQIERLSKVLNTIDEQPVVILFQDSNRWINVTGIVI